MAEYQAFINSINIYAPDDIKQFFLLARSSSSFASSRNIKNCSRDPGEEIYANFMFDKYVANLMDFPSRPRHLSIRSHFFVSLSTQIASITRHFFSPKVFAEFTPALHRANSSLQRSVENSRIHQIEKKLSFIVCCSDATCTSHSYSNERLSERERASKKTHFFTSCRVARLFYEWIVKWNATESAADEWEMCFAKHKNYVNNSTQKRRKIVFFSLFFFLSRAARKFINYEAKFNLALFKCKKAIF